MQAGDKNSPRSLQKHILPSEYCTQNRDSSEKTILWQFCHSMHQSLSLCCIIKGSGRFCAENLTICLCFRELVIGECWDLTCSSVWSWGIHSIFVWQWMDFDLCDERYHGMIIHILDRQRSCRYRIPIYSYYSCYSGNNTMFWANAKFRKGFLNEKSITQLFF